MRAKYTAKWGVQIAGMIFQTRSNLSILKRDCIFLYALSIVFPFKKACQ
ncbi:DUF6783 domain-containing protein [Blautia acetigignens]|uniref:DUF6783 domain-containing protein n=1 Tax=Blautia acetigignens TaxID=2981783 RepID=A0ABV1CGX7_9FIRM